MKSFFYTILLLWPALLCVGATVQPEQIVLVTSRDWSSRYGTVQFFSKTNQSWTPASPKFPVVLGRNGMGWGLGLQPSGLQGPQKTEGDERAPAGVFLLGPVFGYNTNPPSGLRMSYHPVNERDYFVDDPASKSYNQWVTIPKNAPNDPKKLWRSFERMRRSDQLYEIGIVVNHNMNPVIPGAGSAIFLHVWRSPELATVGCTAMSEKVLLRLIRWLSPLSNPVLVQVPLTAVGAIKTPLNVSQLVGAVP